MQNSWKDHFDISSILIIVITVVMFIMSCYYTGLEHDLLLEAGVFLVSVKLIQLSYKASVANKNLDAKLDAILKKLDER